MVKVDELEIRAAHCGSMPWQSYSSPWGARARLSNVYQKMQLARPNPVADEDELEPVYDSQPKRDIFGWAVWMCIVMTGKSPLEHNMTLTKRDIGYYVEMKPLPESIEGSDYHDWPTLPDEELGTVVMKAPRGEYETAGQALNEAREVSQACGRSLCST
ncbi:hypothetical protein LTR86_010440 [Recurvomyces mirabilis]|nr:hypothetical protein LTR86_010440 [Recurvomyces mirabilis]